MQKLGDLISIKIDDPNADLWVIRRGSIDRVGKPQRTYSKEAFGVTVTRPDLLMPEYLYYMLEHLWLQGLWKRMARGTLALVSIRKSDLEDIPVRSS